MSVEWRWGVALSVVVVVVVVVVVKHGLLCWALISWEVRAGMLTRLVR